MIKVSIIIPCRNEEKFIGKCIDSLINQDYPKENLEILVIDGASEDGTKKAIEEYSKKYSFIELLDNPNKYTPFGLNIGIRAAQGEIIVRMDAHAGYSLDYVSKCVKNLEESGADNVGGVLKTLPSKNTLWAKSIAIVLSHRFGAGSSYFRTGSDKPRWVDTVFGGCFRKETFEKVGMYNEKLTRSQDIELNRRIKAAGGKILLVPDIIAIYYPQSTFSGFLKHNFIDGLWTIYPLKFGIKIFGPRHLIPLVFVSSILVGLILSDFFLGKLILASVLGTYMLMNILFSLDLSFKNGLIYFPFLILAFINRHFAYGAGSLWAALKIGFAKTLNR